MTISEIVIAVVFGTWLAASVLVYVPYLRPYIRQRDVLALIPQWNFFAPRPAQHDYALLYRDQLEDGSITDWKQVASMSSRNFWSLFWNPGKRDNKSLFDAVTDLMGHARQSMSTVEISVPYLTILTYVSAIPRFGPARFTQFLLMRSQCTPDGVPSEMLFVSHLHSL